LIPSGTGRAQVKPKERDMAQTLINSLAENWNPAGYHDSYREHIKALLKEKEAGHETIVHTEPERGGKAIHLLGVAGKRERVGTKRRTGDVIGPEKKPVKNAAARKAAAKKSTRTAHKRSALSGGERRAS